MHQINPEFSPFSSKKRDFPVPHARLSIFGTKSATGNMVIDGVSE